MNKKCSYCFQDMRKHREMNRVLPNRTRWVCLDCGEVI